MRHQHFDVVVIGGGLSGLMAALGARRQGAEVAILADGGGALELSSGCIDLWAASAGQPADHPYSLVGEAGVREALDAFRAAAAAAGLPYMEAPERKNQWTVTAIGSLRPTCLTPPGAPVLRPGLSVSVVGFRGMKEFHPGVVAAGLGGGVEFRWIDLPPGPVHPLQVARLMEDPAYRAQVIAAIGRRPGQQVLLPAVLGLEGAAAVLGDVSDGIGAPVGEVPLPSPSLPGLRLAAGLSRLVQRQGAELCLGVRVTGAAVADGRVLSVTGEAAAGPVEYRAGAVVLATGGLLGGGLAAQDRTLVEPVFGLPVELPAGPWASPDLLDPHGHAFVRAGIRTDQTLRPRGWQNLYICGKLLAGYDPYAEGSGGGVAVATGWRAGMLAGAGAGGAVR